MIISRNVRCDPTSFISISSARLVQRRKASRVHEVPIDVIRQRPVCFRFGLHLFPFRIGLEGGPILLCFLTGWMLQNVNEKGLRIWRIFRHPITDALHVMPLEDRVSVIAKPRFERIHLAGVNVIQAEFVNVM